MSASHSATEPRHELLDRLVEARRRSDELFAIVKPEFLYQRPIPERHRIVFYIGHLEAFDWNLLRERLLNLPSFHPEFDRLFAFGIDPVDGGLPSDQPSDWPSLRQVYDYVAEIRRVLDHSLTTLLESGNGQDFEFPPFQLLNTAIEHRLMHAETLAYMLHQLPLDQKIAHSSLRLTAKQHAAPAMVAVPAGSATLGLRRSPGVFGWDNEFEQQVVEVPGFSIARHKVTNAQWLEFMDAGGYQRRQFWQPQDWTWRESQRITHPVFWIPQPGSGGNWLYRTMFEELPLPLDWPVYVSHAEASAYAAWAGKSLPSEAQWHRAAYGTHQAAERPYPWGSQPPAAKHGNFDFHSWDPSSVSAHPEGASAFGVEDLLGNGWEWTSTIFGPLPGFRSFAFYPGYSADFFDGKHYVMKGGSSRTAACMLRRSFRNWFQPHYQYVYAAFRCVNHHSPE